MKRKSIQSLVLALTFLFFFPASRASAEQFRLDIKTAIETALENNLDIRFERYTPKTARERLIGAEAAFDPALFASAGTTDTDTRSNSDDYSSQTHQYEAGVRKAFFYGTEAAVALSMRDSDYEDAILFSDEYKTSASLNIEQPLLKNRGTDVNTRDIRIAQNNFSISELTLKQTLMDVITRTVTLYWNLYAAVEQLRVNEESLKLAELFFKEVEDRIDIGDVAAIEALQAEAEVAARREDVIIAINTLKNRQDELINFIMGKTPSASEIKLTQAPQFELETQLEPQYHIDLGLSLRPDYLISRLNLVNRDIDITYFKNQVLPEVNLTGSLSLSEIDDERYEYDGVFSGNYHSASVGIEIQYPWGLRADRANYAAARYDRKKQEITVDRTRENAILEIQNAIRDLEANEKRYQSTLAALNLARKKMKVEEDKFRQGLSTGYTVLLNQRDFTDAGVRHIDAIIAYQIARASLYQANGTVLEQHGITFEPTEN